eukprot:Anaeramoba_ignava/a482111_44.p1 GENE.a482111_44~~a482111_44.p1  ORF type:complete len:522 (-),score=182.29 a482111_44:237-1604(-)
MISKFFEENYKIKEEENQENQTNENNFLAENSQFLDIHLIFPLLEFILKEKLRPENEIFQTMLELAQQTNLFDIEFRAFRKLNNTNDIPKEMLDRKDQVEQKEKLLFQKIKVFIDLINGSLEDKIPDLLSQNSLTMEFLKEKYKIENQTLNLLFEYSRLIYDKGEYEKAIKTLELYIILENKSDKQLEGLWGKLVCEISTQKMEEGEKTIQSIREIIEKTLPKSNQRYQLKCAGFLMHWSLFVFFNSPNGLNQLIDLFFNDLYNSVIQTFAPHLLRYLCVAVFLDQQRRSSMRNLLRLIDQEKYRYSDPITELIYSTFSKKNLNNIESQIEKCEKFCTQDFFLFGIKDQFISSIRVSIFEIFCKIYHELSFDVFVKQLRINPDDVENWIVNVIRNSNINAKVDSENRKIIIQQHFMNVLQNINYKIKNVPQKLSNINLAIQEIEAKQNPVIPQEK